MKIAALVVAVLLVVSVAWMAGESHKRTCVAEHRAGCSVLPWVDGHAHHSTPAKIPLNAGKIPLF